MGRCLTQDGQQYAVTPRLSNHHYCFNGEEVAMVAAGGTNGAVVTKDGSMWNWGDTCGTGRHNRYLGQCHFFGHNVVMLAFGGSSCVVLTCAGRVYRCGQNDHIEGPEANTFRLVPPESFNERRIVMVASGVFHKMAVDTDGTLWTWGDNIAGELCEVAPHDAAGLATRVPIEIASDKFQGQKVVHVAGGNKYTMVVTESRELWGCGASHVGQTGLGIIDRTCVPMRVGAAAHIFGTDGVRMTACGQRHTLIVGTDNRLWVCGYGNDMNLGTGDLYQVYPNNCVRVPTLIPDTPNFVNGNVMTVSAGYRHSVAVMRNGSVFTWGRRDFPNTGRALSPCGTGHHQNVRVPTRVHMRGILIGHWHPRSWLRAHPEHAVAAFMAYQARLGAEAGIRVLVPDTLERCFEQGMRFTPRYRAGLLALTGMHDGVI